ncbi:HlyD family efflux transporter periplasmic adaptor subunit [Variovorax humicola]|uniref:HlyD family efflux transporter periplasmic adaptor subunit n=1 Tax=Variovorax humicola TaxID=1769758 RepID=A0ABU8WAR9_9BURK
MKRNTLVIMVGAGAVLAGLLAWAFAPRPIAVEVATAAVGPYEQSIVEDARTRLRDRYVVTAPLAGRLARIILREGDAVAADDTVATLTPILPPMLDERTQREQNTRVEAAVAVVQRADANVQRARVGLELARAELRRTEQLARENFIAPAKVETDRLSMQAAQKELEAALQGRHAAEHELETARAALLVSRSPSAQVASFPLRSPVAGRVLKVMQPSETTVALGAPVLEIGDIAKLEIVTELLTTDAVQTRMGALVRIERWGSPVALEGRVSRIEPAAFTKISALGIEEQRVNVLIDITSAPSSWQALGDGYRVGVRIVTVAHPSVLRVPVSAVFPMPGEGMAAFVVAEGRARLVPVDIGGRNGAEAWVLGGIPAGAKVIVYPPAALRDGARVKTRSVPLAQQG